MKHAHIAFISGFFDGTVECEEILMGVFFWGWQLVRFSSPKYL